MNNRDHFKGISTTAIHAGENPGPSTGDSAPPIHMSSTFHVEEEASFSAVGFSEDDPYFYSRWSNPSVDMLSRKIAALEGTEDCACFASGMAAATSMFLTNLSSGDHAIFSDVAYAGVSEFARDTLYRYGIEVSYVDMSDLDSVRNAFRENTRLVHAETPANPIMRITDLAKIAELAKEASALATCDSTFSSPIATCPAEFGFDLVMHSVTKYIGGHGDAIGGAVAGSRELVGKLRSESCIHHGGIMSPFNAWLIARGASTLPLRMKAHEANAFAVARWLEDHPKVSLVLYPGLESHPQHLLARSQMENFSGMIAFQVGGRKNGEKIAEFMRRGLKVIHYAVSLGHHRSLIYWLGTNEMIESSFRLQGEQLRSYRAFAGDGLFRFSVGLEDPEDLIDDLDRVLT
ncbi:MAG: PLP-dependent aspartate aminotransferase family protein [Albidovulum sp.]|nr:PLP-dependent aspartate aminotransferase family protein [Albidovulum sp.]